MNNMKHILVTGVPRSGSTLVCQLLNTVHNVVVLDEPLEMSYGAYHLSDDDFMLVIKKQLSEWREVILRDGIAISVQADNRITQHYSNDFNYKGLRDRIVECDYIRINKPLTSNFILVVKQLLAFSLHLKHLLKRYPMFGIVRNPLAVLSSLSTLSAWEKGYLHHYQSLAPDMVKTWEAIEDKVERVIAVVSIYYEACLPLLKEERIIYYEELVATQGQILELIVPLSDLSDCSIENKNNNHIYNPETMLRIGEKLLNASGAFWDFYSQESVVDLMEKAESNLLS